ncbi:MAG: hypothetical protein ACFFB3_14535 [Candidatus Hodarchaeota archaeon]
MKLRDIKIGVLAFWICLLLIFSRTVLVNSLGWQVMAGDELSWRFEHALIDPEVPSYSSFPSVPLLTSIKEGDILTIHILSVNVAFGSQWNAEYNYTVGNQRGYRVISNSDLSWEIIFPIYARTFYELEASRITANSNTEDASLTGDIFQITHESRFVNATIQYNIARGYQTYFHLETPRANIEYKIAEESDSLLNNNLFSILLGLTALFLLGTITGFIVQPVMDKLKLRRSESE